MKSEVKLQGRIFNSKKNKTRDGATLYNFSMSVSKKGKSGDFINQYISITIYTKDQNFDFLLDAGAGDVAVLGQLSIKEEFTTQAGKTYPQELSIFGFEAEMAGKAPSPAGTRTSPEFPDMDQSDTVPF